MFEYCSFLNRSCPFAFTQDGLRCGLGKGESKVEEIKSCNGRNPKYPKSRRNQRAAGQGKSRAP